MERELKATGLPYERFSAITAKDVASGKYDDELKAGVAHMDGKTFSGNKCLNCWGTIAGTLSHRFVYRKILKEDPDGEGTYLVLEDDAHLFEGWQQQLAEMLKDAPSDWNVILAGWWNVGRCTDVVNDQFYLAAEPHLTWTGPSKWTGPTLLQYWYAGADAVVLSPKRLPPLLEKLEREVVTYADVALLSNDTTRCYAPVNPIAHPWDEKKLPSDREKEDAMSAKVATKSIETTGLWTRSQNTKAALGTSLIPAMGFAAGAGLVVALVSYAVARVRRAGETRPSLLLADDEEVEPWRAE